MRVEHLLHFALPYRSDLLLHHLPPLEKQQRGNALNPVSHAGRPVLVYIQFSDLHPARVCLRNGIHRRRHHAARTAPFRPEVHQDRNLRIEHLLVPTRVSECQRIYTSHNFLISPLIRCRNQPKRFTPPKPFATPPTTPRHPPPSPNP